MAAHDSHDANGVAGFSRTRERTWYASENPVGKFLVWVEMRWVRNGNVEGFARVEYDWYKMLWDGNSYAQDEYCWNNFI